MTTVKLDTLDPESLWEVIQEVVGDVMGPSPVRDAGAVAKAITDRLTQHELAVVRLEAVADLTQESTPVIDVNTGSDELPLTPLTDEEMAQAEEELTEKYLSVYARDVKEGDRLGWPGLEQFTVERVESSYHSSHPRWTSITARGQSTEHQVLLVVAPEQPVVIRRKKQSEPVNGDLKLRDLVSRFVPPMLREDFLKELEWLGVLK